ncbi:MAG: CDP-alcohol phosphatidyltransferase family protein [Pyrinomonadaceae bacterium]|nr:CDP-alcohol phosphatidyltransferase family protein [Blastocatellia bacterium]MCW5958111.1 CDP-alcohol phosphatidyltransferase family protein [Pyrinomonadaceae bacterium]
MEATEDKEVHKGLKKGLYVIPTAFTAANIGMGFLAVLYSIRAFSIVKTDPVAASAYFNYAAIAIGLAILFDTLDGRVARMTKTATELGVQFDSLADVLTFGIAPIALMYSWAIAPSLPEQSSAHALGVFLLFMYLMCGAFRLARFNIQATRPRVLIEGTPKLDKKNFVGLPIPPAAGLLASIVHFAPMPLNYYGAGLAKFYTYLLMVLIAVLGILMVSTLRYTSFKTLNFGKRNLYLLLVIAAAGMLLWLYSNYLLLILATLYVSHGLIFFIVRTILRRPKPETLEAES